ncbi:hypothetical protein [Roseibacillus ishigakijimensis]|uniref:Lipopolysaccharide assembly protein A domain-containing protein n=1 Tax=Roseibacillus ishigakijimensis TaxID=454146 RepID=A0A934VKR2_9BACT|nr:hypothetical protein [Roseibacillus ishigakijimensis]MBK1833914.1 hypothetical protein [Roseibacillus ishigakijimensis]
MDAAAHFLTQLALWNFLLGSLCFLFGLLMGCWIWRGYRRRWLECQAELQACEEALAKVAPAEPGKGEEAAILVSAKKEENETAEKKAPGRGKSPE